MTRGARIFLAMAAAFAIVGGVAVAATPVYVSVAAGGPTLKIRPGDIHLISNENLHHVRWTSWGGRTADGTAADHGNGPSPGHLASNPVTVQATKRRRCGSKLVYTAIKLRFTKGVPYVNEPHHSEYDFGCPVKGGS
jgi:hypothetical protein